MIVLLLLVLEARGRLEGQSVAMANRSRPVAGVVNGQADRPDHRDSLPACGDCPLPLSRDASRRGVKTWHIAIPAVVGAISVPLALFMGSPTATITVVTITPLLDICSPAEFLDRPSRFLIGAAAAAGIALINTVGNIAGFAAGYTRALKDLTGGYVVPMFCVGAFMLLSAILMVAVSINARSAEFSVHEV